MRQYLFILALLSVGCSNALAGPGKFFHLLSGGDGGVSGLPSANLQVHMDASDLDGSLNDGDSITTWSDKSGNNNDAAQSTAGFKPVLKKTIVNGQSIIRCDGTDDEMDIPDFDEADGGAGLTILMVFTQSVLSGNESPVTKWEHGVATSWALQVHTAPTTEYIAFIADTPTNSGSPNQRTTDFTQGAGTFHVLSMVYDGGQGANNDRVKFYKNKALSADVEAGTTPATLQALAAVVRICAFSGSLDRNWNGDIAEWALYNVALSDADRNTVEDLWLAEYGL